MTIKFAPGTVYDMAHLRAFDLELALAKEALAYDRETGIFTWKISPNRSVKPGDAAGTETYAGYLQIKFRRKIYRAHRLAWMFEYGVAPNVIDHIDGNRKNNAIANLRDVDCSTNMQNRKPESARSKTGFLGVIKSSNRSWKAVLRVNGKGLHLGSFGSPQEAYAAYVKAKREMHPRCTI